MNTTPTTPRIFLKDEIIETDASKSFVAFEPMGIVLAVMPWNFPFWQVFRFAAPALMAGNAGILKHASNVPGSALAIEEVFHEAGFPKDIFRTLLISASKVENIIKNPHVRAVTLTGSEPAGMQVAATAGRELKKTVLELGGSDPFIVLEDADIPACVLTSTRARMLNVGQSCIAAKRFIVVEPMVKQFEEQQTAIMTQLKVGDPLDEGTKVGPMARKDLMEELDAQVQKSIALGARLLCGGKKADGPGAFYLPTVLTDVKKGMPAYDEETFGPVSAIIPVKDAEEAIFVANDSEFGLGGSVWSRDIKKAEAVARRIETGAMFVNGMTKSDPRLPFGGVKKVRVRPGAVALRHKRVRERQNNMDCIVRPNKGNKNELKWTDSAGHRGEPGNRRGYLENTCEARRESRRQLRQQQRRRG